MKPNTNFLKILSHVQRHSPAYKDSFKEQLRELENHYLKRLLEETKTNEKFMYSGRVQQIKELLTWFDEAEDILLKRLQ